MGVSNEWKGMSRRIVAKKNMPKTFRAWVKEFKGKDIVRAYRKHFNASLSCAVIELAMMGVPFPDEEIQEAKRSQVGAIQANQARKAKKKEARRLAKLEMANLDVWQPEVQANHCPRAFNFEPGEVDRWPDSDYWELELMSGGDEVDDFDPFADD